MKNNMKIKKKIFHRKIPSTTNMKNNILTNKVNIDIELSIYEELNFELS